MFGMVRWATGPQSIQWHLDAALSQEWSVIPLSDGNYEILNAYSGKALEVAAWSTSDGARIQQWSWGGGDNQQWRIEQA